MKDGWGQDSLHSFFENVLSRVATKLHSPRHSKGQLDDTLIQEGCPGLERVGHAHAVDFHQNVVGQKNLEVGIELPVQQIFPRGAEGAKNRSRGVERGQASKEVIAIHFALLIGAEM